MENPFRFDPQKALEVILYISERAQIPDIYHIGKILYFADLAHLEEYGRFICGDYYVAMKDGPVPSRVYDIIKDVRDNRKETILPLAKEAFSIDGYRIIPLRQAEKDFFSKSDLACLDKAIEQYSSLPFGKLKDISHDAAYETADMNGEISVFEIAKNLKGSDDLIQLLGEYV
ncbi:MAG: SocA family protein [Pyrinomonadaceae bacterium]|nr:SocA family protein [Pyrinomonadaceae bacterium]